MYSIVLADGKIISIKATDVEWCEKSRMIKLIDGRRMVARINMDNVVGWIKSDYSVMIPCQDLVQNKKEGESEDKK
jgi:hypothetical protein